MLRTSKSKLNVLWPQFVEAERTLHRFLDEVTDRVIRQALGEASDDVVERPPVASLPEKGS